MKHFMHVYVAVKMYNASNMKPSYNAKQITSTNVQMCSIILRFTLNARLADIPFLLISELICKHT